MKKVPAWAVVCVKQPELIYTDAHENRVKAEQDLEIKRDCYPLTIFKIEPCEIVLKGVKK